MEQLLKLLADNECTVKRVNGAIVIEPSVNKNGFKPKDGDILSANGRAFIFSHIHDSKGNPSAYCGISLTNKLVIPMRNGKWTIDPYMYATEEEKQQLFDALAKDGKHWNAEKKCIEDLPYQPKDKELVWAWGEGYEACRIVCFYDAKDACRFTTNGERKGLEYDHYAPFTGEIPQWAKEALTKLQD